MKIRNRNITFSFDEDLLSRARVEAKRRKTSLNALLKNHLQALVSDSEDSWIDEFMKVTDEVAGNSKGKRWKRSDLYDAKAFKDRN